MQLQQITKTYIILLVVPLFWGGAFATTKHVLTELPPLTASAVRFLAAGLIMALWAIRQGEWDWQSVRKNWPGLIGLGISGVFFYNFFFATGLQYTSAAKAALIIATNPVFTACAVILFMGEIWSWRIGLGVILSLAGVIVVITQGNLSALVQQSFGFGEIYMLGALISWVAYTLIAKRIMQVMNVSLATSASTISGAIMLAAAASVVESGWSKLPLLSLQSTLEMTYLAIFPTFVAFIIFNRGIQLIGATKAAAYINLTPVNALWIAAVFYGETVTAPHLIGMALTISGVLITTQTKAPRPSPQMVRS